MPGHQGDMAGPPISLERYGVAERLYLLLCLDSSWNGVSWLEETGNACVANKDQVLGPIHALDLAGVVIIDGLCSSGLIFQHLW
jgi:hypothetical protein